MMICCYRGFFTLCEVCCRLYESSCLTFDELIDSILGFLTHLSLYYFFVTDISATPTSITSEKTLSSLLLPVRVTYIESQPIRACLQETNNKTRLSKTVALYLNVCIH
eukprot:GHVQ01002087.1.p2 GENE.GHVQ01002087.1~~GHVQ01002087.1.p2  ORF type:complete len:108 (+),score=14.33 GHVQ01002087.1:1321-1644(+)